MINELFSNFDYLKNYNMKKIVMGLMMSADVFSCTTVSSTKSSKAQPSIANSKWVLADDVKGKTPTLNIEAGKLTGNGGCNNYFGEVALDAASGSFAVDKVGSTRMACDNMSSEQNYFKMLSEANRYSVSGNVLEIYKDGLLLMKFNKAN